MKRPYTKPVIRAAQRYTEQEAAGLWLFRHLQRLWFGRLVL